MKPIRCLSLAACVLALGCAPEDYRNYPGGDDGGVEAAGLSVRVTAMDQFRAGQRRYALNAGQNAAYQLLSLKYYVRSILVCQDLETEGTAFRNPNGCLEVYRGDASPGFEYDDPSRDLSAQADLARADDQGFVDIARPDGRATLGGTVALAPEAAGSYEWGIVTWYLPVKVTAEIALDDAFALRTHDGETVSYAVGDGYSYKTVAPGSFADGSTAEEAVILHPNGGSWFRFQNPFTITEHEIAAGAELGLDLTFDPEGIVTGYREEQTGVVLQDSAGHSISVSMLDLTPVPHPQGTSVRVESYRASIEGVSTTLETPEDNFDLRLDLYSIEGDPDETIYGATLTTLVNEWTYSRVPQAPKIAFVATAGDETLTFKDWSHRHILSGFTRQGNVGTLIQAWLSCGETGFRFAGCGDDAQSATGLAVHFTLESIRSLP